MISFGCIQCGKKFRVSDDLIGKSTTCPQCGALLKVPNLRRIIGFIGFIGFGIVSLYLLYFVVLSGSPEFNPNDFDETASYLKKTDGFKRWKVAFKAQNPLARDEASTLFHESTRHILGQPYNWTAKIAKLSRDGAFVYVSTGDVVGYTYRSFDSLVKGQSDVKATDLKVGQNVRVQGTLMDVKAYGGLGVFIESEVRQASYLLRNSDSQKSLSGDAYFDRLDAVEDRVQQNLHNELEWANANFDATPFILLTLDPKN